MRVGVARATCDARSVAPSRRPAHVITGGCCSFNHLSRHGCPQGLHHDRGAPRGGQGPDAHRRCQGSVAGSRTRAARPRTRAALRCAHASALPCSRTTPRASSSLCAATPRNSNGAVVRLPSVVLRALRQDVGCGRSHGGLVMVTSQCTSGFRRVARPGERRCARTKRTPCSTPRSSDSTDHTGARR